MTEQNSSAAALKRLQSEQPWIKTKRGRRVYDRRPKVFTSKDLIRISKKVNFPEELKKSGDNMALITALINLLASVLSLAAAAAGKSPGVGIVIELLSQLVQLVLNGKAGGARSLEELFDREFPTPAGREKGDLT